MDTRANGRKQVAPDKSDTGLLWCGAGIILLSWAAAHAGVVPVLGLLLAYIAPDVFLIGVALLLIGALGRFIKGLVRYALAVVLILLAALNTRIPSIFADALADEAVFHVTRKFRGPTGQPIHLVSNVEVLSARNIPYDSTNPACYREGCFMTRGFQTARKWYWEDDVGRAIRDVGFQLVGRDERAMELRVTQTRDGVITLVKLQLLDPDGGELARFEGRYRNGFPAETPDAAIEDRAYSEYLAWEYLLHGHFLARAAGRLVARPVPQPVRALLSQAVSLSPFSAQPTSVGRLSIIEQKTYDPVRVLPREGNQYWSSLSWDRLRSQDCSALIKPEDPQSSQWYVFTRDSSGRKKIPSYLGMTAICDSDVVWLFDYASERNRMLISRFTASGDLSYRLAFYKPDEPAGYPGSIMLPTFTAANNRLEFEWWNTNQSGPDREVIRTMKVRIPEPRSPQ